MTPLHHLHLTESYFLLARPFSGLCLKLMCFECVQIPLFPYLIRLVRYTRQKQCRTYYSVHCWQQFNMLMVHVDGFSYNLNVV